MTAAAVRTAARGGIVASGPSDGISTHVPGRVEHPPVVLALEADAAHGADAERRHAVRAAVDERDDLAAEAGHHPRLAEQLDGDRAVGELGRRQHGVPRAGEGGRLVVDAGG